MKKIEKWLTDYIAKVDPDFSNLTDSSKLSCDIFHSTSLDSLGIMNVILDAEKEFSFSFTADNFQDRRLRTVSGLCEIIEANLNPNDQKN